MSTDDIGLGQEQEGILVRTKKAVVWDYFEKITGDDGLPKTRCTRCNTTYNTTSRSGTSTMRRHLQRCFPQPLAQLSPTEFLTMTKTDRSSDELANEAKEPKKSKSVILENLQIKTDRELMEFIWRNRRNIGLLEQKLPDKAKNIKEVINRYEDELDRRAKLQGRKEQNPGPGTSIVAVKIEMDDQPVAQIGNFSDNLIEDGSVVEDETTTALADVNEPSTSISSSPEEIRSELQKVSSVLSMLTSPNNFFTPQDNPLDEKAEEAKQTLNQLLKKDFETIVGSPDEQTIKSCIEILIKNLHKLPRFQGRVIESLHTEFESSCNNWITLHNSIQANIAYEAQHRDNLEILQEWQEKDVELESKIAEVDEDIVRLKAELCEKERNRERLVKGKADLFNQSRVSVGEAKKLLEEMVGVRLQSDVAIDSLKDLAAKWERNRQNFILD